MASLLGNEKNGGIIVQGSENNRDKGGRKGARETELEWARNKLTKKVKIFLDKNSGGENPKSRNYL